MKIRSRGIACVLLIAAVWSCFVLLNATSAETVGPSAIGKFEILTDNGPTRSLEFSALSTKDGRTFGEAVFQDTAVAPAANANNSSDSGSEPSQFFMRAQLDCLVVKGNRAVMSGNVTESSFKHYIGRRFLLVAQDSGEAVIPPQRDKITWGIYRPTSKNWYATDEERPEDGAGPVSWLASDFERPEDEGVISSKDEVVGCQTFPVSSFSFIDGKHGRGSVQVRP